MNTRARVTMLPALLVTGFSISALPHAVARGTFTAASLQPTGLDEIVLTVEEDGVKGMPESIEAGRYLVKVSGPAPGEMGHSGAVFAQLPDGLTAEQAYEDVLANPNDMPSWYLDAHFGGGAVLSQGTETWAVLDFGPGAWMTTTTYGSTLPVEFEVTGELPTDLPAVESNVTLDVLEMAIEISSGAFVAGENVLTVNNTGDQLHFVDVGQLPDGTTKEQVQGIFDFFMTGTPPADDTLKEDDLNTIAYIADISPGVSEIVPLTLEAGTYLLACWVPDTETFAPHAMMGMWDVIVVE